MCGRYEFSNEEDIAEVKKIIEGMNDKYSLQVKMGEIFPMDTVAVLRAEQGKPVLSVMSWGFPKWDGKGVMINARSETIHEKKMFKGLIVQRRCVVLATGFYEWQKKVSTSKKDKYFFTSKDNPMLYMAGIYNTFQSEDGQNESFVILTQDANQYMEDIHDRQPVMLFKDELKSWLTDEKFVEFAMNRGDMELQRRTVE